MEANLLVAAKKYVKERQWYKAIDSLKQIINQTEDVSSAEVYTLYAKSLRRIGNSSEAINVLKNGLEQYPLNEKALRESLNLYDSLADWHTSKQIVLTLININSENADYLFRLGRVYSFLGEFKKAEQIYIDGLKMKHQMSFEELIAKVQSGFANKSTEISSEYTFIDGRNNLGAFIHQYGNRKFLTKISKSSRSARREVIFYKDICTDFPHLDKLAPSYIDSKVIDSIIYLTIEMIDDNIPIKVEHADKIITTSSEISKIRYNDIIEKYPNPNYLFQFKNRPISIIIYFTQIHTRYYNDRLFSSIYNLIEQNNYPETISKAIQKLESLIMDNKLYLFIKPEEHYSLLQGDFTNSNILIKRVDETPIIIDWGAFNIGPHFMDPAKYLSSRFFSYSEMKSMYFLNNEDGRNLSLIENIFFLYAMSLLYIVTPSKKTIEEKLSDFIFPAINDIEILVAQFKENGFDYATDALSIEKEDVQININKLNKTIQTLKKEMEVNNNKSKKDIKVLKKENKTLQTKFNNLLNSKSWKLTAPLRKVIKLTEKRKK